MERYNSRTIDEFGRVVLHRELRDKLQLQVGDRVLLEVVSSILVMHKVSVALVGGDYSSKVEELGMVALPNKVRNFFKMPL